MKTSAVVALFAILTMVMTYPLVVRIADHAPSDLGDPLYSAWVMSWYGHKVQTGLGNFWDTNIFHPHRGTLLYADPLYLLSVLSLPITLLTGNALLAHNVLVLLSFLLCAFGMYALVLHLTRSQPGAVIAGLVFAFCPYRFAHISHVEILAFGWMPLCFLFLHKFFEKPTWGRLAGFGVFYVLQALSCAYYAVYITVFAGLFIVYFAYRRGEFLRRDFWLKMGAFGLFAFAVLAPFFIPFLRVHETMSFTRGLTEIKHYSPQLQHFLAVPANHLWLGRWTSRFGNQELQLYPGLTVLALAVSWWIARARSRRKKPKAKPRPLFRWWTRLTLLFLVFFVVILKTGGFEIKIAGARILSVHNPRNLAVLLFLSVIARLILDGGLRRRVRGFFRSLRRGDFLRGSEPPDRLSPGFYTFMAVTAWLLSLGPIIRVFDHELIEGPYYLLFLWFPGFQGLRVPARLMVFALIGLSVLCGYSAARILRGRSLKAGRLLSVIIASLILLDFLSLPVRTARAGSPAEAPAILETLARLPPGHVHVELPMPESEPDFGRDALAMYHSTRRWNKMFNGYSGYFPPGFLVVREAMEAFPSASAFDMLTRLDITHVLLRTRGYRAEDGKNMVSRMNSWAGRASLVEEKDGYFLFCLLPMENPILPEAERNPLPREAWTAGSNKNDNLARLAFDGDEATRWSTYVPQAEGDFFRVDIGSIRRLSRVDMSLRDSPLDFPRGFVLEGSKDGGEWTLLDAQPSFFPLLTTGTIDDFSAYKVVCRFDPADVRFLRFVLTRSHPDKNWSIHELSAYE